jgi:hypothetical protein
MIREAEVAAWLKNQTLTLDMDVERFVREAQAIDDDGAVVLLKNVLNRESESRRIAIAAIRARGDEIYARPSGGIRHHIVRFEGKPVYPDPNTISYEKLVAKIAVDDQDYIVPSRGMRLTGTLTRWITRR